MSLFDLFGIKEDAQPVDAIRSGKELRERQEEFQEGKGGITEELMKQNPDLFNQITSSFSKPVIGNKFSVGDMFTLKSGLQGNPLSMLGIGLMALQNLGPNYRSMIEKDLTNKGFTVDSTGKIVQTGDYATPQNIMAGYNLAAPGITASAFDRYDKIREGIKKGIFKDKIRAQQKLDALGQFALEKERARKAAYDKAIQDAKNAEEREQARIDSITAGYGGYDYSPGATGPTAAGAGMGVGGGYASDYQGLAKGGIASL